MVDLGNLSLDLRRATGEARRRIEQAGRTAWIGLKSATNLAGAVAITAAGGAAGFYGLERVRLPDPVLLQRAKESARAMAAVAPSAIAERDMYLMVLAVGAAFVLGGIWSLYAWWSDPLGKRKAKSPA
jgi:hypothetical protein